MSEVEPSLDERLERLELQVARIIGHLGLDDEVELDLTDEIPPEVIELARAGRQMEAIRRYTDLTGADVATATSIVNAII